MNRSTDLLEPTVPDLLELDSDFLRLDFPFDLRGISLLNFRNCRRQLLQIFLQKHNFQKWTFPTGNYCKQQKAWQNWKNCQNDGADSFSIDNDDRESDDQDDDEKSLVALQSWSDKSQRFCFFFYLFPGPRIVSRLKQPMSFNLPNS